jgi:glycosyltransferase involved in cell wall biosynthesis
MTTNDTDRPMRVALNATALLSPLTGIGQYSFQLARELLTRDECTLDLFYGSYWDRRLYATPSKTLASALPWIRNRVPKSYQIRRWIQNRQFYRHTVDRGAQKFDIYHEPNYLPLRFDGPTVITVHDLSWIRHPETHPKVRVDAMNRYFEPGLRRANAIITDSSFVKGEVMDVFGIPSEKIFVVPLGVEAHFRPLNGVQTRVVLERHQLKHGQYFLAVGTLEPRKNLSIVLRAYVQLPHQTRQRYPLVLIGMKGWRTSALEAEISPLVASGQVRQLGYTPREELHTLIAGARALVYPSIYEGFGLPPLEAMACGIPVICANSSSLPEVVGEAGVLIDPYDEGSVIAALCKMADDDPWQMALSSMSRQQSMGFNWTKCAQDTLSVYRSVLK